MATFNLNPAWSEPITISIAGSLSEDFPRGRHDLVRFDAEFLQQIFERRRCAEAAHPNYLPLGAGVALPSESGSHLHGNPRAYTRRKDTLLVCGVLAFEKFPRRHADDTNLDARRLQFFAGFHAKRYFAAAAHEDYIGFPARSIRKNVSPIRNACGRSKFRAIKYGHGLARPPARRRYMGMLQD